MNLRCIIKPTKTQEGVNYKKIISIMLLAVVISTSVLFTGCGGEVAPSNAQTSDKADTTALSETTPTANPNQFSFEVYDYKTNELISKANKNNLDEKLKEAINLTNTTSEQKVESIDVEPTYVILLSYLKDTSRDLWFFRYMSRVMMFMFRLTKGTQTSILIQGDMISTKPITQNQTLKN